MKAIFKLLSTAWALLVCALIFLGPPVIVVSLIWAIIQWAWL